ncbi:MAG: hypothetical protein KA354_20685 [Phycisphaerae bacterium]|nr:hypothetical protein [Phycisphaerae bacterium]
MIPSSIELDVAAHDWLTALYRASWQGAIGIVLVWCLCRWVHSIPPWARCWMWRLVLVKVLLVALSPGTIDLPWLPQPRVEPPAVAQATPPAQPTVAAQAPPLQPATEDNPTTTPSDAATDAYPPLPASDQTNLIRGILVALWALGVAGAATVLLARVRAARRWRKGCLLVKDASILSLCEKLAGELGLSNPPLLLIGDACESPIVFGALRTSVVLPASLVRDAGPERLQMILRHEMAHIRRGDLVWNWVATAIWGIFFFHPLVWIALRELRLNQELACDACALAHTDASLADYGTLLVELADRNRASPNLLVTVGVVESFEFLKRRLKAMRELHDHSRWMNPLSISLLIVALVGLLPWRLVAQPPRAENGMIATAAASKKPAVRDQEKDLPADDQTHRDALATISAGKYKINVDAVRWVAGKEIAMVDTGFPFEMNLETREDHRSGPGFDTRTMTRTGGGGFGGSFYRPNLVVDLRVEGPKGQGNQLLCAVVGKVQASDDRGGKLDSPETPSSLKLELSGVDYPRGSGCAAVHLNIADRNVERIRLLDGKLLVADARVRTTVFKQDEIDRKPTHRLKGAAVRLDDVASSDDGVTVALSVSSLEGAGARGNSFEAMGSTAPRVRVVLEDGKGNEYSPQGFGAGTTGGGSGGGWARGGGWTSGGAGMGGGRPSNSFSFSSRSGGDPARSGPVTTSQTFTFSPLPEGVGIKKITCTITELVGKPQGIAFKFHDLPVP